LQRPSCEAELSRRLAAACRRRHRAYGLHRQDAAMMTVSPRQAMRADHAAFLDGARAAYATAVPPRLRRRRAYRSISKRMLQISECFNLGE